MPKSKDGQYVPPETRQTPDTRKRFQMQELEKGAEVEVRISLDGFYTCLDDDVYGVAYKGTIVKSSEESFVVKVTEHAVNGSSTFAEVTVGRAFKLAFPKEVVNEIYQYHGSPITIGIRKKLF